MKDEQGAEASEHLSPEEFLGALEAMSADGKLKMMIVEKRFLRGTGRQQGELYHETVCRTLMGERHCPRGLPTIAYMIETMRSIASHDREKQKRFVSADVEDELAEITADGTRAPLNDAASAALNPEQHMLAEEEDAETKDRDTVATIYALFDGDDECQMVIMGWADGKRGKDLRDLVGVDQKRLDYLIKKIHRAMTKKYPNGFRQ